MLVINDSACIHFPASTVSGRLSDEVNKHGCASLCKVNLFLSPCIKLMKIYLYWIKLGKRSWFMNENKQQTNCTFPTDIWSIWFAQVVFRLSCWTGLNSVRVWKRDCTSKDRMNRMDRESWIAFQYFSELEDNDGSQTLNYCRMQGMWLKFRDALITRYAEVCSLGEGRVRFQ